MKKENTTQNENEKKAVKIEYNDAQNIQHSHLQLENMKLKIQLSTVKLANHDLSKAMERQQYIKFNEQRKELEKEHQKLIEKISSKIGLDLRGCAIDFDNLLVSKIEDENGKLQNY